MESPRVDYDTDGIAWVLFDDPDSKVNILGVEQMQRLDAILDELSKRKPKAVIFTSGKPGFSSRARTSMNWEKSAMPATANNSREGSSDFRQDRTAWRANCGGD